jgi:hypothetical protein
MKNNGVAFRSIQFPERKHYVLQLGKIEARIITSPEASRPFRSFVALVLAIGMFKVS